LEHPTRNPAATKPPAGAGEADERARSDDPFSMSKLRRAIRRARVDEAERSEVIAELRGAEYARLEILKDALAPLLAEVPRSVDLFDVAIMPGSHPRLFIDMIGFVEMGRDRRAYRFVQDTRHGRAILAETENLDQMVAAITDYMARRLLEREKALAADRGSVIAERRRLGPEPASLADLAGTRFLPKMFFLFSFLIEVLGSAAFFTLLAMGGWYAWKFVAAWGAARF
jgi:hypothetical protein